MRRGRGGTNWENVVPMMNYGETDYGVGSRGLITLARLSHMTDGELRSVIIAVGDEGYPLR